MRHVSPEVDNSLYKVFKRNIGRTATVAIAVAVVVYLVAPLALSIPVAVVAAAIVAWAVFYVING